MASIAHLYHLDNYKRNLETGLYEVRHDGVLYCLDYDQLCQMVFYLRSFWPKTVNRSNVETWYKNLDETTRGKIVWKYYEVEEDEDGYEEIDRHEEDGGNQENDNLILL